MKNFLKAKTLKLVVFLTLIFSACAVYCFLNPSGNFVYSALSFSAHPFLKTASYLSGKISGFKQQFKEKEKMQAEIHSLKRGVSQLRDKLVDYEEAKNENARLAKYCEIKKENESLKSVCASVIGMDLADIFCSFTIDKGENSGISKNDIVLTENGVVGLVSTVGAVSAKVKSILSPECKLSVFGCQGFESGILCAGAELAKQNLTAVSFLETLDSFKTGEIIVTAGVSGTYPKNLKIGVVKSLSFDQKESCYRAVIEPFETVRKVRDVFVVTDFNGKGAVLEEG